MQQSYAINYANERATIETSRSKLQSNHCSNTLQKAINNSTTSSDTVDTRTATMNSLSSMNSVNYYITIRLQLLKPSDRLQPITARQQVIGSENEVQMQNDSKRESFIICNK